MKKLMIVLLLVTLLAGCAKRPECTLANLRIAKDEMKQAFSETVGATTINTPKEVDDALYKEMIKRIDSASVPKCFDSAREMFKEELTATRNALVLLENGEDNNAFVEEMIMHSKRFQMEYERLVECAPHCD